jgi:hypothetical protein
MRILLKIGGFFVAFGVFGNEPTLQNVETRERGSSSYRSKAGFARRDFLFRYDT